MILTSIDQIARIIIDNEHANEIKLICAKSKVLKAHVTGIGAKELVHDIDGFERKSTKRVREKLMLSNVDIVRRILNPRDKIYTAKGGIEMYNLSTTRQKQQFKEYLSECAIDKLPLKEYVRNIIQKKFDYDPMGLKWVEVNDFGNPYPCFKSIECVFEWQLTGRKPEYVFFNVSEKERKTYLLTGVIGEEYKLSKLYRVVCDGYDRLVSDSGAREAGSNGYSIIAEFINPFGMVPGEIVSNIPGDEDYTYYESSIFPIVDLLSNFMFQRSVFEIAFSRTAYPKEWMTKFKCPTCGGAKTFEGKQCPECKGTGVLPNQQNADTLVVEFQNDVNKNVPVPPMGAIHSPIENLQFMKDNNISIEEMLFYTKWGMFRSMPGTSIKTQAIKGGNVSNTAYEAQLNDQPKRDELRKCSSWMANTIKWYADVMGEYIYGDNYINSAIIGGDRYMEESPDATFSRLLLARQGGASKSELDSLAIEYFENKYQGNPLLYRKAYLLFLAEPFVHEDNAEVITYNIPEIQKLEKIYFDEWVATLPDIYYAAIPDNNGVFIMQNDLRDFVEGKFIEGAQADALLFSAAGELLNIGDNVQVRETKALLPEHTGKDFKVTAKGGKYLTLQDSDGMSVNQYGVLDVTKLSAQPTTK